MSAGMPMTLEIPARAKTRVTGEELLALGDIGRSELIEGEIIAMPPTSDVHGNIESNIDVALKPFVRRHKLGRVMTGEVGIYIRRDPDTARGADVVFISNARLAQRGKSAFLDVAPELVVEVMSPEDRWNEVMKKLADYFSIGVRLVWVIDAETQSVYAYRSLTDVRHFTAHDTLPGDDVLPGFVLPVAEIFAD
jgi:Uma2 family endonuclease